MAMKQSKTVSNGTRTVGPRLTDQVGRNHCSVHVSKCKCATTVRMEAVGNSDGSFKAKAVEFQLSPSRIEAMGESDGSSKSDGSHTRVGREQTEA